MVDRVLATSVSRGPDLVQAPAVLEDTTPRIRDQCPPTRGAREEGGLCREVGGRCLPTLDRAKDSLHLLALLPSNSSSNRSTEIKILRSVAIRTSLPPTQDQDRTQIKAQASTHSKQCRLITTIIRQPTVFNISFSSVGRAGRLPRSGTPLLRGDRPLPPCLS